MALSAADMDVDKACSAIQCEGLQALYEFIFSDWKLVPATDMKSIKQILKKEGQDREVYALCVGVCVCVCKSI